MLSPVLCSDLYESTGSEMTRSLEAVSSFTRLRDTGFTVPMTVRAEPPYITDDPEPVEYRHWEVYVGSIFSKQTDAWTATASHLEVNYGAVPNLQLHTILPIVSYVPRQRASSYGYGDTELGVKCRGDHQQVILSAGPALQGSNASQGYFAYQLTFGS